MPQSENGFSLDKIGFYTLSDHRASQANGESPMWRCEMILTNRCNFKCPYCRGLKVLSEDCTADMDVAIAHQTLDAWIAGGLKNIRFSGGEPTLYPHLGELISRCKDEGVERIAISTNGSCLTKLYEDLVEWGVNDFSISLDACCATFGNQMAGVEDKWHTVVKNIARISELTYVTVGVVLTPENVGEVRGIIEFAHELGVADIRIISAAQYNELLDGLSGISDEILEAHPILKYRIQHFNEGRNVRGIQEYDTHKCYLVRDDSVVAGRWHFPCVIAMREGCQPIGEIGPNMREERMAWFERHDSFADPICRENCLDVCIDYNNKCASCARRVA